MDFDIPKNYFLDEVRDGFFVPSMIKKSWANSIVDYKILEEICNKLGLNIYFMFGSLIAIVRHAGSIPWDDDIDSMMLHADYGKLMDYLHKNGVPENFSMKDYSDMGNGNLVRKWTDNATAVKSIDRWKESFGFPFINNVDVMMLDYIPDSSEDMQYYQDVIYLLQYIKDIADMIESGDDDYDKTEFDYSLSLLERLMKIRYDSSKDGKLSIWTWKILDDFTLKHDSRVGNDVASFSHYLRNGNGRFPKSFFQDFIEMPYEFTTVKVPIGYDGILRDFFGDYMTPRLEWDGHVYPFYKDLEKALIEKYDTELLRYHYNEIEVSSVLAEKEDSIGYKDVLGSTVGLFQEAHAFILDKLGEDDRLSDENKQAVLSVLGSCQELAVNLGNTAENKLLNENEISCIVTKLEDYCERVFEIYNQIDESKSVDLGSIQNVFGDLSVFFENELSKDHKEKTKVLFLCVRSSDWKSLHSIWEAASSDDCTEVKVVAVPYYIKDGLGSIVKDDMQLELDEYPEDVLLTPYDKYDLQAEHPDIVIYQSPYDECSDAMTIHPYYYVKNIRKYAEKLVFVPPFTIREISAADERSKYAIGCFICNPGTVYADMVIVQSEGMKDIFVSILNKMVNRDLVYLNEEWKPKEGAVDADDFHDVEVYDSTYENYVPADRSVAKYIEWEKKLCSIGSASTDWNNRRRVLIHDVNNDVFYDKTGIIADVKAYDDIIGVPSDWIEKIKRKDDSWNKVLLYCISSSVAFEYGEKVFKKAKSVINMIKEQYEDEITVLFFADRNYRRVLRKNNPKAWSACQSFVEFIKKEDHIYDDSQDAKRAAKLCDACYGDGSYVMNLCREYGKPVMIQDPKIGI